MSHVKPETCKPTSRHHPFAGISSLCPGPESGGYPGLVGYPISPGLVFRLSRSARRAIEFLCPGQAGYGSPVGGPGTTDSQRQSVFAAEERRESDGKDTVSGGLQWRCSNRNDAFFVIRTDFRRLSGRSEPVRHLILRLTM